jgi:dTDP-4-amino-4,6-dideoxygalactose transaminase
MQAAFLSVKLPHLDQINRHKRQLADLYRQGLSDDFIKPCLQEGFYDVYHIFNIRHDRRDELKGYLAERGIQTEIHYPVPPHRQKALQGMFDIDDYPLADAIHSTTLSLPISVCHTEEDVARVIDIMNRFLLICPEKQ